MSYSLREYIFMTLLAAAMGFIVASFIQDHAVEASVLCYNFLSLSQ